MNEDSLILNVVQTKKERFEKSKIFGNRGERIRQRKALKTPAHFPKNKSFQRFSEFDSGLTKDTSQTNFIPLNDPKSEGVSTKSNRSKNSSFTFSFDITDKPKQSHDLKFVNRKHNNNNSNTTNNVNYTIASKKSLTEVEDLISLGTTSNNKIETVDNLSQRRKKHKKNDERSKKLLDIQDRKTGKSPRVISSLFKNNPEVPHVTSKDVVSVKEDVFSHASFKDVDLQEHLVSQLELRCGFTHMTRVQQEAIPAILAGRDVLVKSQTGSGKTLSYAVPLIQMLQAQSPRICRSDGVYALVIVPTRELAIQSFNVFQQLVNACCWVVPCVLMGGEKRKAEKARIRKGVNILVSTPGRLLDHLEHTTNLLLNKVSYFVIDEADRLLDLGFEMDISKITKLLDKADQQQQTILLSATLSDKVEKLAGMTLRNPHRVDIAKSKHVCLTEEDSKQSFALPEKLRQFYVVVPAKLRLVALSAFIIAKMKYSKVPNKLLIFLSTQDSVSFHYDLFTKILLSNDDSHATLSDTQEKLTTSSVFQLYGDMPQKERSRVYKEFRATRSGILLSTDVAARGLDLPHITWIIQYTTPGPAHDYIHRVGRTARIGTAGHALLFLLPNETEYVEKLSEHRISLQSVEVNSILSCLKTYTNEIPLERFTKRDKPRTSEESATFIQMLYENYVYHNSAALDLATKAFLSFVRAYATYPGELKAIFQVRNLHLGHIAKSFALSEAPTKIGQQSSQVESRKRKHDNKLHHNQRLVKTTKPAFVSEFDSGLGNDFHKKPKL